MKSWNAEVFGFQDLLIDLAFKELSESDLLVAVGDVNTVVTNFQYKRMEVHAQV